MHIRNAFVLGACFTLFSTVVSAHGVEGNVESSGDGYVNTGGMVLKTGLDECLQTGTLNEDNIINVCAGIVESVEEEVEEVKAVMEAPEAPAPEPVSKIDTQQFSEQTLFDTNSADLNSAGEAAINSLFGELAEYKDITGIMVTGHTDSRGSEAYNQALSESRAQSVATAISARYPDTQIDVSGKGENSPVASNFTAEGRQLNRRVEVEVTATRTIFN